MESKSTTQQRSKSDFTIEWRKLTEIGTELTNQLLISIE